MRRDHPEMIDDLRVIDSLGPSTIQPIVAASWLAEGLKADLRSVLLEMDSDPMAQRVLSGRGVQGFVSIADDDYDDIRHMRDACLAEGLTLHREPLAAGRSPNR